MITYKYSINPLVRKSTQLYTVGNIDNRTNETKRKKTVNIAPNLLVAVENLDSNFELST